MPPTAALWPPSSGAAAAAEGELGPAASEASAVAWYDLGTEGAAAAEALEAGSSV